MLDAGQPGVADASRATKQTDAQICASESTNRLKGFLGTADEMTSVAAVVAPHSVAWVKSLSDDELFPLGERALQDIADDILVLDEIRQRFRLKGQMRGYSGWKEFVEKNSRYSMRTIQNRLAEVNGKDASKINTETGNQYTRPAGQQAGQTGTPWQVSLLPSLRKRAAALNIDCAIESDEDRRGFLIRFKDETVHVTEGGTAIDASVWKILEEHAGSEAVKQWRSRSQQPNEGRQPTHEAPTKPDAASETTPAKPSPDISNVNWSRSPARRPLLTRFAAWLSDSDDFWMEGILKECDDCEDVDLTKMTIKKLKQTIKTLQGYQTQLEEHRKRQTQPTPDEATATVEQRV